MTTGYTNINTSNPNPGAYTAQHDKQTAAADAVAAETGQRAQETAAYSISKGKADTKAGMAAGVSDSGNKVISSILGASKGINF